MRNVSFPVLEVNDVSHNYAGQIALRRVSFSVQSSEMFALIGPNGGGKTTLFKILTTLMQPSAGEAVLFGYDVVRQAALARQKLGIVFQSPSLDKKLTVQENLMHQGHLYGLSGRALRFRMGEVLEQVGLSDRARTRADRLSGGMQRRVEIAKAILHEPALLILDEPGTGLDPNARLDVWHVLREICDTGETACLMTTHLFEEAEKADRVGILHKGQMVACGSPGKLMSTVGGIVLELESPDARRLRSVLQAKLGNDSIVVDDLIVRVETGTTDNAVAAERLRDLVSQYPEMITHAGFSRPGLEDVFVRCTGHRFRAGMSSKVEVA